MNRVIYCDPQLTIIIATFLALAVFVGVLAAGIAIGWLQALRARRLRRLHAPKN